MGSNDCDAMRPLLAGHLYNDLPAGEKERVEAHVGACAACREALASMRQAASALDAWVLTPARKPVPAERPTRRRYVSRKLGPVPLLAWAAAAAVFVLALTLHFASRSPAPREQSTQAPRNEPEPAVARPNPDELEKARREAEEEIARLEAERRRSLERLEQIEREWEKLRDEKPPAGAPPRPQELARVEAERTKTVEELNRSETAQRKAEEKLVRAETRGTVAVVGQLDWVQGEVYVLTPSGRVPARTSKALVSGQGLESVGADSVAVVKFPDLTRLEVGAATTIRELSDADKGKQIDLVRGSLKADVRRQPDGRPMVIRTSDAEVRVLGTRLRLVSQDATRLEVQEGRVRLTRSKDGASLDVAAGTYAVTNVPRMIPRPIREVAFQDGSAPVPTYAGARDAFLSELNSTHNYGTGVTLQVDGDNPGGSGKELRLLLRWDTASIPPGSKVQAAAVVLRVSSPSQPPYAVHAMKRAWSETEATWMTSSADKAAPTLGFALPAGPDEFTFPLNAEGVAVVQSWVDSPGSNFGLMVTAPGNSSGMKAHSRESSEAGKRPKLVVTYTPRER